MEEGVEQEEDLVQSHDEGTLLLLQQVDGLDGLRLQAVHDVHHQDGDVAQRAASVPQITADRKSETGGRGTDSGGDGDGVYLKDSCPGVSMISMPGILMLSLSN